MRGWRPIWKIGSCEVTYLERGGKTLLTGGLRGAQEFLDIYSDRLPWYFEKALHHGLNEPYRTIIKNCGALGGLLVSYFVVPSAYELMHTPEIYSGLSALVENLHPAVGFLVKEVSGPLVGLLASSSGGYIAGSFVGAVASAVLGSFGGPEIKINNKTGERDAKE